jgi:hypothetical protein
MAGINVVRRWVMSQMTKKADDGIMITLPEKNKVDLNVSITMDRLLRNGIDPDQITNPQQVDNAINMINSRMVNRAIPADSDEGREITKRLFGKQKAPVFDLEGNRIPEGSGIMGGKSIKNLMETGQVSKGARGMKKSKKVQDREMFQAANKRLTSDVDSIIKNIKSMEPITAMKEANSVIARKGKYKNLTQEQSKKILQDTEDHIFERDIPEDPEGFAKGGRIGFKGGADMSTVADSKGNVGAKSVSVSPSGSVTTSNQAPSGPDDKGSPTQNLTQYLVNQGYTPKEIRIATGVDKPSTIDKIKNSPYYNNPITKAGLYALNPSLGFLDYRTLMQAKNLIDYTTDQINNPVFNEEEVMSGGIGGMTSNLITDQQKSIIDKQGNIGKLTGAFNPDDTFDAAKQFDDKGSSGIFGIGERPAEPMTREEFDNYVKEKGYATGGRAGFMAGGMGRRGFLKMLAGLGGGIAAAKTGLLKLAGKEPVKQVAKEVVQQSSTTPPPYFFKLAEKIKKLGSDTTPTNDRTIAKSLKSKDGTADYILEEDMATGDIQIKKVNMERDDMINDIEIMELRRGEVVRGTDGKAIKTPDEYDEVTESISRIYKDSFNDPDYSEGIRVKEIMEEVIDTPSIKIKKAGGGIARMLGE